MRRRDLLALAGAAAALPRVAFAQQVKTKRLGLITAPAEDDPLVKVRLDAFWAAIGKQGWNAANLLADLRFGAATADVAATAAAEVVALKPNVLVVSGTAATTAVAALTKTIPIVFAQVGGATITNLIGIQNFGRPGGNITGFANAQDSLLYGKYVDFVRELMPSANAIGVIFGGDTQGDGGTALVNAYTALASAAGLKTFTYPARSPMEVLDAIAAVASAQPRGLIIGSDAYMVNNRTMIIAECAKYRLPAVWGQSYVTPDGALVGYGPDLSAVWAGAGDYCGLVLNGIDPGGLAIQTTPLTLSVNLKAARTLGVTIPQTLLYQATDVIQ